MTPAITARSRINVAFYVEPALSNQLSKIALATDQGNVFLLRAAIDATDTLEGVTPPPAGGLMLRMRLSADHNERIETLASIAKITKSEALRVLCQSIVDQHRGLL